MSTRLFAAARPLLEREATGERFRLIGVIAQDFSPAASADQGDLVDRYAVRDKAREHAIDSLRDRFGDDAVMRGIIFAAPSKRH